MIVKVQVPIVTSSSKECLVYSVGKENFHFIPCTDDIEKAVGNSKRAFFNASIVNNEVVIDFSKKLRDQGW